MDPLFSAINKNNTQQALALLKDVSDVNKKLHLNQTLLHIAADGKDIEIVKALIEKGADVNAEDVDGNTPLHTASQKNNVNVVHALVRADSHIYSENSMGYTAFHYAVHDTNVLKFFIDDTSDEDLKYLLNIGEGGKATPLYKAVGWNNVRAARLLLSNKANVNAIQSDLKETALHLAARIKGSEEMVTLLLAYRADVDAKDINNETPLVLAKTYQNTEVVKLLIPPEENSSYCATQ